MQTVGREAEGMYGCIWDSHAGRVNVQDNRSLPITVRSHRPHCRKSFTIYQAKRRSVCLSVPIWVGRSEVPPVRSCFVACRTILVLLYTGGA